MPSARRVVPFGNPRVNGHLRLDGAYRSLSRPSSPPRAQASTMCPFYTSCRFSFPIPTPESPGGTAGWGGEGGSIYIRLFDFCSTLNFSACINMSMNESLPKARGLPSRPAGEPTPCGPMAFRIHGEAARGRERVSDGPTPPKGRTTSSPLQKGGVPAAPSGTATLLRLSPNHQFHPRPILAVTDFRRPRLSWLDGRCVQGPGTYSPRHG